jgi:ABC-type dipeptide/oligopeptide/nickel transport system permease subunit
MATNEQESKSLWHHAWDSLMSDRTTVIAMSIVLIYSVVALLSSTGLIVSDWSKEVGPSYAPPSSEFLFGLDIFGRSVFAKTVKATEIAMSVGLVTGILTVLIGVTLGSIAGYYGGKIDEVLVWFYTTVSSIPGIMLLISIAFIVGKGLLAVYLSLGLTSWTGLFRLIRGEFIRHKDREYVQAATAIGGGDFRKIFKHILPNVFHIVIINFSLQFQFAIKSEVILSYLGLGVQGVPSWGTMINDAKL